MCDSMKWALFGLIGDSQHMHSWFLSSCHIMQLLVYPYLLSSLILDPSSLGLESHKKHFKKLGQFHNSCDVFENDLRWWEWFQQRRRAHRLRPGWRLGLKISHSSSSTHCQCSTAAAAHKIYLSLEILYPQHCQCPTAAHKICLPRAALLREFHWSQSVSTTLHSSRSTTTLHSGSTTIPFWILHPPKQCYTATDQQPNSHRCQDFWTHMCKQHIFLVPGVSKTVR